MFFTGGATGTGEALVMVVVVTQPGEARSALDSGLFEHLLLHSLSPVYSFPFSICRLGTIHSDRNFQIFQKNSKPLNSFVLLAIASPSNEDTKFSSPGLFPVSSPLGEAWGWISGPLLSQNELQAFRIYVGLSRQWGPCCLGALFPGQHDGLLAVFCRAQQVAFWWLGDSWLVWKPYPLIWGRNRASASQQAAAAFVARFTSPCSYIIVPWRSLVPFFLGSSISVSFLEGGEEAAIDEVLVDKLDYRKMGLLVSYSLDKDEKLSGLKFWLLDTSERHV